MANESGLISANIFEKCLPAISTDIARCGSVTLCNVGKATGDTLADIFSDSTGQWRNMLSLLVSDFEIKSCGAKVNGLYEFIMANTFLSTDDKRTLPFSIIRFQGQYSSDYAVQFACMVLVALPALALYFAFSSRIMEGATAGAVKG